MHTHLCIPQNSIFCSLSHFNSNYKYILSYSTTHHYVINITHIMGPHIFNSSQPFYCWVQDAAFNVSNRIVGTNAAVLESKVCSAALRLMLQILNWDFRGNKSPNESSFKGIDVFCDRVKPESNSIKRTECVLVQVSDNIIHAFLQRVPCND